MDPRVAAEFFSNCVMFGVAVWIGVVGAASLAGMAVWWEAVRKGDYGEVRPVASQLLRSVAGSGLKVDGRS